MKKSVLALAVAGVFLASSVASATVVYDKDGHQLSIGGRIEALWHSGHDSGPYDDHTIRNRTRFGVSGRTKLTDWATGYGAWEHQWEQNGNSSKNAANIHDERVAYVGVDFGKFGAIQAGRWEDWCEYAGSLVDWLEDDGNNSQVGRDRNSGKIGYKWSGYGVDFMASYQTAVNNYTGLGGQNKNKIAGNFDAEGGFSASLGYTSPDVLFGPISVRTSYQYVKGQDTNEGSIAKNDGNNYVKDTSLSVFGLAWGNYKGKGPYIGAVYSTAQAKFRNEDAKKAELKAFEVLVGYGFSNGIALRAAYAYKDVKNGLGVDEYDGKMKLVTLAASWDFNKNFRVWGEAHFDCDSDDGFGRYTKGDNKKGANVYKIGARYMF